MNPPHDQRPGAPGAGEQRWRALVEHSADAGLILDRELRIELVAGAAERIFGATIEVLGAVPSMVALVDPEDRLRVRAAMEHVVERPGARITTTCRLAGPRGPGHDVEATITNLLDDPDVAGLVVNVHDITDRRNFERALAHQSMHDPLTGLPGRALVLERLRDALTNGRERPASVVVLLVDLDRFKVVNDSLGHREGDRLLLEVARRLVRVVRVEDTVARIGGDEFVVTCRDVEPSELEALSLRILRAIERPVDLVGGSVTLTASVGVVTAHAGSHTADGVLRDADAAMYVAKGRGRNRFAIFDEAVRAGAIGRLDTEKALRRAVDRDELMLHYQPIVDLRTQATVGVEALLRWEHPERGLVEAAELIPVAEESGLIATIGTRTLELACAEALRRAEEDDPEPVRTWVNLSAQQLAHPDLLGTVRRVLQTSGLAPRHLGLEITESGIIRDPEAARAVLASLRTLGVAFALDDFGTGYSSLSHLRSFAVDVVKIDRSFVHDLEVVESAPAIVGAVVSMSHALGLTVVAEGVETAAQLDLLRTLGCDAAQGHLLGHPVPAGRALRAGAAR